MSGRSRGRPRGRPKGSGRGRGRGRACQTDGTPFPRRSSQSPPPAMSKLGRDGGLHVTSITQGFSLNTHPGAPPGTCSYGPPHCLQPPGLPQPQSQLHLQGGVMSRNSFHAKSGHKEHPDQSAGRVSSGTQASWQATQQTGYASNRYSQDGRATSGLRHTVDSSYNKQNAGHSFVDHRSNINHANRARKTHRHPKDLPVEQEPGLIYSSQKEKRLPSNSQRPDKDLFCGSQRQSSDKTCVRYQEKDMSHRIHFQNMEPSYQKPKRDLSYPDRDPAYVSRRPDRDPFPECADRQAKEQRYSNSRHDREQTSRRERDAGCNYPRSTSQHRSSSAESNYMYNSQCAERNVSPQADYYSRSARNYGRDSRHNSVDSDTEFSKNGDSSGERYYPTQGGSAQFPTPAGSSRHLAENLPEPDSRHPPRDNLLSSSRYCVDSHLQSRNGCSAKSGKHGKSYGSHASFAADICGVAGQFSQRGMSCPDVPEQHCEGGHELRPGGKSPVDTSELQECHVRRVSSERSLYESCERSRSHSRQKQPAASRDHSAESCSTYVEYTQQDSCFSPSPCPSNDCDPDISSDVTSSVKNRGQSKSLYLPSDEDYAQFGITRQQPFQSPSTEQRPVRPRRLSVPLTPPHSPSPYPTSPQASLLDSSRSPSPSPVPFLNVSPRRSSPARQKFSGANENAKSALSSCQAGNVLQECNGSREKQAQAASNPSTFQSAQCNTSKMINRQDCSQPVRPTEPMAWQQQYLKHLQQQQQLQLQEEQPEKLRPDYVGLKQQEPAQPRQLAKQQRRITENQAEREQFQRQQMRRQQEQMHREYLKIQQEKLQQEQTRQQEELQREQIRQQDQLRREQSKQLEDIVSNVPGTPQQEYFRQQQEKLHQEQLRQQEEMRREHIRQQEHMQREHLKLQQEFAQRLQIPKQGQTHRELQEHPLEGNPGEEHQRLLPGYIVQRCEQVQQYTQQSQLSYEQSQQLQISYQQQKQSENSYAQLPPQELRRSYDQHSQISTFPYGQRQSEFLLENQQQQQQSLFSKDHHQQAQRSQFPFDQLQPHQHRPLQGQKEFQLQKQPCENEYIHRTQQSHPAHRQFVCDSENRRKNHQPVQQHVIQYQQPQKESGSSLHQSYHLHRHSEQVPVPPWRQISSAGLDPERTSRHSSVSPMRHSSQAGSPARPPHLILQAAAPAEQHLHSALPVSTAPQTLNSAVQQMSQNGGQTLSAVDNSNYNMPVSTLVEQEQSQMSSRSQTRAVISAPYQNQHYNTPRRHDSSDGPRQTFDPFGSSEIRLPFDEQPKKPPWLQDQDIQTMCMQKKPPWQQQTEHVIFLSGQKTVVSATSQFPGIAVSAMGTPFSVQENGSEISNSSTVDKMPFRNQMTLDSGAEVCQQNSGSAPQRQQNILQSESFDCSSQPFLGSFQTRVSVEKATTQQMPVSESIPSLALGSSEHYLYSLCDTNQEGIPSNQLNVFSDYPTSMQMYSHQSTASNNSSGSHAYLPGRANESVYQYQIRDGGPAVQMTQSMFEESTEDQMCAQQVLVEALNEQVEHNHQQSSAQNSSGEFSEIIPVMYHNRGSGLMPVDVHQQSVNKVQTYTLHHLFDDHHRLHPQTQVQQNSVSDQIDSFHNPHPLHSAAEPAHQVVPGNPLDAAVAMLNFPDSALDIPMIEQHQVFVLEPPGTTSHSRHQPQGPTTASSVCTRRNSWHTPQSSTASSGTGSFADDDAALVIDLSAELVDDDDDIFTSKTSVSASTSHSSTSLQTFVNSSSGGINELGLRISSVFSLATSHKRKRRTMSDSVLQEVEVVARQEGFTDNELNTACDLSDGSKHHSHFTVNLEQNTTDREVSVHTNQKTEACGISAFSSKSPDPLAELTKLLFTDVAAPSPGATAVEDWNLKEAAGVSFVADSVCVPGTPARSEPEALTTPLPQLRTPGPQYIKDPGTPFLRNGSLPQFIKSPATSLPACTKEIRELSTPISNHCMSAGKEQVTVLPGAVKELKDSDTPLSSCAMGPPTTFSNLPKKVKDPTMLFPQCTKDCSVVLSAQYHGSTTALNPSKSEHVKSRAGQSSISENIARASKQSFEQITARSKSARKAADNCPEDALGRSPRRERLRSQQKDLKRFEISPKTDVTVNVPRVQKKPGVSDTERDVRSRVKDNWEQRCVFKNASTPKTSNNRSRDSSKDCNKERHYLRQRPESSSSSRPQENKDPPSTRSARKSKEEEEKKSCGVRGRRSITIAGKRKLHSGRSGSAEGASPERSLHKVAARSDACKPWLHRLRTLSQDSSEGEQEAKGQRKNSSESERAAKTPRKKESVKNDSETLVAEDLNPDAFFPNLSRSNSTDSIFEADGKEKRQRLSSCESRTSRLSSQSSCGEDVGENIADMILPTVFPPSRRHRTRGSAVASSADLLATFHEHKLRCLELEGEHYVVLEELLSKCFPGLPRAQVERARLRDLNLLAQTVHLLGSGLPGDRGDSVSVLALPDAARLLHFFHGMMHCPGNDCKLKASSDSDKDIANSDNRPSDNKNTLVTAKHNSESSKDDRKNEGKSVERRRKDRIRSQSEDSVTENDLPDDTRSCSSDQTVPYCDGHPLVTWDEESRGKYENHSDDGEFRASPICSSFHGDRGKFRRHSSEMEEKIRKLRDKDNSHGRHRLNSPERFLPGETSPMLPPLLAYTASPYTPGSMYNVPMDNERVLLECFSAPGSQAPSSVRSAPSIRVLSPDRTDHPHLEDELFEGLSNHKQVSDFDALSARCTEPPAKPRLSCKDSEMEKREQQVRVSVGALERNDSTDYTGQDFTGEIDTEENDDVFLEDDVHSKEDNLQTRPSDYRMKNMSLPGEQLQCQKEVVNEPFETDRLSKDSFSKFSEKILPCESLTTCRSYAVEAEFHLPKTGIIESLQVNYKPVWTNAAEKEVNADKTILSADDQHERDNKVFAIRDTVLTDRGTHDPFRDKHVDHLVQKMQWLDDSVEIGIAKKLSINNNVENGIPQKLLVEDDYEVSAVKDCMRLHSIGNTNKSEILPDTLNSAMETMNTFTNDPTLSLERKGSATTVAYGASDDEADENSNTERSTLPGMGSHNSTGPPELSTANGSVQINNSPQASPPPIERISEEKLKNGKDDFACTSHEIHNERIPPDVSDGSLEQRVQDFITHGSQFTPRTVVRSNSLPDLCGAETLRDCQQIKSHSPGSIKSHSPGSISARSNSYPGASVRGEHSNAVDGFDRCSVLSPATSDIKRISDHSETDLEDRNTSEMNRYTNAVSLRSSGGKFGASDRVTQPEETEFLDPVAVIDGGEICVQATPRRGYEGDGDMADQLFEWAVPCALHGSAFCSCEGIDVQTLLDVAGSPRVGPWLCTPAPATPFCDYSKLIYSPFPVENAMTPARPDTADAPAGSPNLAPVVEPFSAGCGMKRLTPPEDPPAAKRRTLSPSKRDCDIFSTPCYGASANDDGDATERNNHVTETPETEEVLLRCKELELITAAQESERTMANLSSEDKMQLPTLSPEISEHDSSVACVSDKRNLSEDLLDTAIQSSTKLESNSAKTTTAACDSTHTEQCEAPLIGLSEKRSSPEILCIIPSAEVNNGSVTTFSNREMPITNTEGTEISSEVFFQSSEANIEILPSATSHSETNKIKTRNPEALVHNSEAPGLGSVIMETCSSVSCDISDANFTGATDNDVRIIALGDFSESDIDLTSVESEDSTDSSDVSVTDSELKMTSGCKKTLTLAQYKERQKRLANSAVSLSVTATSGNSKIESSEMITTTDASVSERSEAPVRDTQSNAGFVFEEEPLLYSAKYSLASSERVFSSKPELAARDLCSKLHRAGSVPAKLSRNVPVELKRSLSFHGHQPDIKRFKLERDSNVDTTNRQLGRHVQPTDVVSTHSSKKTSSSSVSVASVSRKDDSERNASNTPSEWSQPGTPRVAIRRQKDDTKGVDGGEGKKKPGDVLGNGVTVRQKDATEEELASNAEDRQKEEERMMSETPEHFSIVDNSVRENNQSSSLFEEKSGLPEERLGLNEESLGLCEENSTLHDESLGLLEENSDLLEESSGLHDDSSVLHGDKSVLHDDSSVLHDDNSGLHKERKHNKEGDVRPENEDVTCDAVKTSDVITSLSSCSAQDENQLDGEVAVLTANMSDFDGSSCRVTTPEELPSRLTQDVHMLTPVMRNALLDKILADRLLTTTIDSHVTSADKGEPTQDRELTATIGETQRLPQTQKSPVSLQTEDKNISLQTHRKQSSPQTYSTRRSSPIQGEIMSSPPFPDLPELQAEFSSRMSTPTQDERMSLDFEKCDDTKVVHTEPQFLSALGCTGSSVSLLTESSARTHPQNLQRTPGPVQSTGVFKTITDHTAKPSSQTVLASAREEADSHVFAVSKEEADSHVFAVSKEEADSHDVTAVSKEEVDSHDVTAVSKEETDSHDVTAVSKEKVDSHDVFAVSKEETDSHDVTAVSKEETDSHDVTAVSKEETDSHDVTAVSKEKVDSHDVFAVSKEEEVKTDSLASLLQEKERMLAEFRKRAMELERTVQDLRVELRETKKKTN